MLDLNEYRMHYDSISNTYSFYLKVKDKFNTEYYKRLTKDDNTYYYAIGAFLDFLMKGKGFDPASGKIE